jgi:hypothetical protein
MVWFRIVNGPDYPAGITSAQSKANCVRPDAHLAEPGQRDAGDGRTNLLEQSWVSPDAVGLL